MPQPPTTSPSNTVDSEPLSNPPIVEAIFDLRAAIDPSSAGHFEQRATELVAPSFPDKKQTIQAQVEVKARSGVLAPRVFGEKIGYSFHREAGDQIVQFREDGFTLNQLSPYTSFDAIVPEVQRWWKVFLEVGGSQAVTRVALRYINKIDIPDGSNLDEYFTILSGVPLDPGLGGQLVGYLSRNLFEFPESAAFGVLALSSRNASGEAVEFILDIDVFSSRPFEPESDEIWSTFSELRKIKNRLFRGSLTESCIESFR